MKLWNRLIKVSLAAGAAFTLSLAHGAELGGRAIGVFGGAINDMSELEGAETESRLGGALGLIAEWGQHGNYSLAFEPMLAWRGPAITNGPGYEPDLTVLEIPILARRNWQFRDHNRLFVFAGPNLAFPLAVEGNIAGGTALEKDDLKPFEFLMDAGLGGTVRFALYWHLIASVRYSHGFTEVLEDPIGGVDEWKTRNVKFLFGIMHHIPGT